MGIAKHIFDESTRGSKPATQACLQDYQTVRGNRCIIRKQEKFTPHQYQTNSENSSIMNCQRVMQHVFSSETAATDHSPNKITLSG